MTGKRIKAAVIVLFFVFSTAAAWCADIEMTSSVNPLSASLDDYIEVSVIISGADARKAGTPVLDPSPDFVNMGVSTQTSTSIINFDISFTKIFKYTLKPTKTGSFQLGGASLEIDGTTYKTKPKTVDITAGGSRQQQTPRQPGADQDRTPRGDRDGDVNIFIRSFVENEEPYVGQQITHTFELYHRLALLNDPEYDPPTTTGFWSVDLPKSSTPTTKAVNGNIYRYTAIKTALFPTTSGELTVGEAELKYTEGGFFAPNRTRLLSTEPIIIKVKPLPNDGKPANFAGAVGNYTISAECDKTTLKVGDVVTVRVTVAGTGNIDLVSILKTPSFSAFKTYDPRIGETLNNSGFEVGGSKSWDYVLSPRYQGEVTIESFSLSFFNPKDQKYYTVSTDPIELTVQPGDDMAFTPNTRDISRNTVENIASDIRFIKQDKSVLLDSRRRIYSNPLFYLVYIVPFGALASILAVRRRSNIIERNTGLRRRLNAWKNAERLLFEAEKLTDSDSTGKFSGKLTDAVTGYIGDKLNIDTSTLTTSTVEDTLRRNGVSEALSMRVRKMLELCDFVRFSSDFSGDDVRTNLLTETREILDALKETLQAPGK